MQAWLLDLDGTLYHPLPVKLAMAAELGLRAVGATRVIRRFRAEHETLRREVQEDVSDPFQLQVQRTANALGVPEAEVDSVVREWMVERPGPWLRHFIRASLVREVKQFREGGGKTAVVSDYPARSKLQAMRIAHLFDIVVASGDPDGPSRLKPAPSGYLKAAEKLGVSPEACLVIGDRQDTDGVAAASASMRFRRVG